MNTALSHSEQQTLVQLLDIYYQLFSAVVRAQKEKGSKVDYLGLNPALIEPTASALDILLRRNKTLIKKDPLLSMGEKIRQSFMLAVTFYNDPQVEMIEFRLESLSVCASVLLSLYLEETQNKLISLQPETSVQVLQRSFLGLELLDNMVAVDMMQCAELAQAYKTNSQLPQELH